MTAAFAVDGHEPAALRALSLDRGPDEMRGTPADLEAAWADACRSGWRPACNPAAFEPSCDAGDALRCLAEGWRTEETGDIGQAREIFGTLCEGGLPRACGDLARVTPEPERASARHAAACDAGVGSSCRAISRVEQACTLGDGMGCLEAGQPGESCALGHAQGCIAWAEGLSSTPETARQAVAALDRGCQLGSPAACTESASRLADGRGVPPDPEEASRRWITACEADHGPACRALAARILDGQAEGIAISARTLYQRGCDLEDRESCQRLARFALEQRRPPLEFVRDIDFRWFLWPNVRPYLGGSIAGVATLAVPAVDRSTSRSRLTLRFDTGAADFTFGAEDRFDQPQNHTFSSLDWTHDADPWGVLIGVSGLTWQGAPDFLDREESGSTWPDRPLDSFGLTATVNRLDVWHGRLFGPNTGLGLSLSSAIGEEDTHNRIALGLQHDRDPGDVFRMDAARLQLDGWIGTSVSGDTQAAGVVLEGNRALPLARGPGGHPHLALVVDGLVAARWGEVPRWLEHHAPARLGPDIGTWSVLRGQPATRLAASGLARGLVELRWSVGEYHGLPRPIEVFVIPFGEFAAAQRGVAEGPVSWFGDAGASLAVSWGTHATVRADAMVVPGNDGPAARFGLVLEQVVGPW